ncbi:MAG: Holliday junction branch migration DNA helicase RuvB [Planctomycetes bacterium]|nr:Holliday junction branch migration DNA helicase RuvB [Planctomycetota bacterium]
MARDGVAVPPSEPQLDLALRPRRLDDFVGQRGVVLNLRTAIDAARMRGEALDHLLLSGLPGLGKTTLAEIVAAESGVGFHASSGPAIERPADLVGLLTALQPRDVLFIDEIHRLPRAVEEYLYSAMEDFSLVIMLDKGMNARSVPMQVNPFTLVGATTREGLLTDPFRARFGLHEKLEPYDTQDLRVVAARSARLLKLPMDDGAAEMLAQRARGTPRIVNRFVRRVRDFVQTSGATHADEALTATALARLGLDESGLLLHDRKLLTLLQRAGSIGMGLKSLAVGLGEDERTVEDVYEPFLIREGYMTRTPRGRMLTARGTELLGNSQTENRLTPDC